VESSKTDIQNGAGGRSLSLANENGGLGQIRQKDRKMTTIALRRKKGVQKKLYGRFRASELVGDN